MKVGFGAYAEGILFVDFQQSIISINPSFQTPSFLFLCHCQCSGRLRQESSLTTPGAHKQLLQGGMEINKQKVN